MVPIQSFIRVNARIRAAQVRLIGPEGEQLGVVSIKDALDIAAQHELDLVEVASTASPPVCRVMDFSKYKYDQEKKEREVKKHQHQTRIKEIRIKPHIEEHDYQVKLRHIVEFLEKKDKVKVNLFFRGREMAHRDIGRKVLDRVMADIAPVGQVEKAPAMEGRILSVILMAK